MHLTLELEILALDNCIGGTILAGCVKSVCKIVSERKKYRIYLLYSYYYSEVDP